MVASTVQNIEGPKIKCKKVEFLLVYKLNSEFVLKIIFEINRTCIISLMKRCN